MLKGTGQGYEKVGKLGWDTLKIRKDRDRLILFKAPKEQKPWLVIYSKIKKKLAISEDGTINSNLKLEIEEFAFLTQWNNLPAKVYKGSQVLENRFRLNLKGMYKERFEEAK